MKTILFSIIFILNSVTACTPEKNYDFSPVNSKMKEITTVPFLTRRNEFIYVDKKTLKPVNNQRFQTATIFTPTGFAVVANEKNEHAVINESGGIIVDFSPYEIDLNVVNGYTFYKRDLEYEKKMPFYKWDWNIMGGGIKKEQTYHKTEIGIIETRQILLQKDVPYLEGQYYLDFVSLDEKHVFWNGTLYEIKKGELHKIKSNIADLLDDKRYLAGSENTFSMYGLQQKKAIHSNLRGTETLSIRFGQESIVLHEVNKERYAPEVPKLFIETKYKNIYAFPQYDKVFPKEIKKATPSQMDFIRKTSLLYSINNSPYFLLGVFNYDHNIWAYEWLYLDTEGNVVDKLENTYNFKVLDQVGNLVWPDRKMISPDSLNTEKWKFGKISSYTGMEDVYIIPIEDEQGVRAKGLWNSRTQSWEIKPEYHDISVLDAEKGIYALQEEQDGLYTLYDNKNKKRIGSKGYDHINSDGWVHSKQESEQTMYYYIDIYSGREYIEE